MRNKHIILAGNTAWGIYNFRGKLIQTFITNSYKVTVLAPEDKDFTPKLKKMSANFINTPINPKGTNPIQDLQLLIHYNKIFKREKPDFIFFYTIKPNIYGSMAAQHYKIPHIAVTTGLGYIFLTNNLVSRISKRLYKIAFKNVSQIWFLNNDDKQTFLCHKLVDEKKAFIIKGEGIDLDKFYIVSLQKNIPIVFLLVARMLWDKGIGEFVEAARIIKQKYPNTKFQLLGYLGVNNPAVIQKEQMDKWQAEGFVDYLGFADNVKPFIDAATCIVLPSYREGIPFTLLEAAASGKPIITTNTTGCKEVIEDGVTGFMCEVKDVESLAACMEKIIKLSPEEYKDMALAGRTKMEKEFDVQLVMKRYLEVLDSNLG
jgi:glycosyltransferase involved in cell wall biosynthesis